MTNNLRYVVRIVLNGENNADDIGVPIVNSMLLDCLRYAGIASEPKATPNDGITFDLYAPVGIGPNEVKSWSERNAERIRSMGINAVSAPRQ